MTSPKINTIKRGGARLYVHPASADKVPGVTSVLNMLPKPFLKFWAAKATAQAAVDNLGEVVGITLKAGPDAAVDFLKRAPDRDVRQAADKGTEVHDLFETKAKVCMGIEGASLPGRLPPDLAAYAAIFDGFVEQFSVEFVVLEGTVWSETHGYAGSFDFIAWLTDPDTGERMLVIGDWKTTRSGVHAEVALQLAAYAHADYIVTPDGEKAEIPPVQAGIVVHVAREDKNDPESELLGQVYPARIDDDLFETFKALQRVFAWDKEQSKNVLGNPVRIKPAEPEKPARRARTTRKAVAA